MIDDRAKIAHAIRRRRGRGARQSERCFCDRRDVGLEAEQARPDLVVQLKRGAPALIVLGGDHASIKREVLGADVVERAGERVEAVDDRSEFQHLRA